MKRNVAILIFNDAEVLDFAGPFEVFSVTSQLNADQHFNVFTVGKSKAPILAVNGLSVNPDYSISDHPAIDFLIIAGGQGSRQVIEDRELLEWVDRVHQQSELTISICSGSRILAKLGLLDNRPYCTHHDVYEHIKEIAPSAQPQFNKRFVRSDDRIFTSGGISAGIDLSFHVVEQFLGKVISDQTARYMEYDRYVPG